MGLDDLERAKRAFVAVCDAVKRGTLLWRVSVTVLLFSFFLWGTGKLSSLVPWHPGGFAFADESSEAREKIRADVEHISGEVYGLKSALNSLSKAVSDSDQKRADEARENATRQVRRQIFETERDACSAKAIEMRDLLLGQAQSLRSDFRNLTGGEYPPFNGCSAYH